MVMLPTYALDPEKKFHVVILLVSTTVFVSRSYKHQFKVIAEPLPVKPMMTR